MKDCKSFRVVGLPIVFFLIAPVLSAENKLVSTQFIRGVNYDKLV